MGGGVGQRAEGQTKAFCPQEGLQEWFPDREVWSRRVPTEGPEPREGGLVPFTPKVRPKERFFPLRTVGHLFVGRTSSVRPPVVVAPPKEGHRSRRSRPEEGGRQSGVPGRCHVPSHTSPLRVMDK